MMCKVCGGILSDVTDYELFTIYGMNCPGCVEMMESFRKEFFNNGY